MKRILQAATLASCLLLGTFAFERDASACGGCFGPSEVPTVVTDHRMVLTIAQSQSTLYDQIKYSGSPESFAWVLPIAGTVDVGLSADLVFALLDRNTQTRLVAPPRNCPPPPNCPREQNAPAAGFASDAGSTGGVGVLKQEVVGPYETVQLQSSDPLALDNWLVANGFAVPADVKPVIATYVAEKFNFLALKLVPGKGVQDMRPVRVTTTGASAALPLRMVAAGTGATVGISLWVLAEGRYDPQNFPFFTIDTGELVWDWTTSTTNYKDLRAQKTAAGAGRSWEIESSIALNRYSFEQNLKQSSWNGKGPYPQTDEERAQQDYSPVKDANGTVTKTAAQVRDADLATLFSGNPSRVTRMRADLAHAALDQDLALIASQNQTPLPNVRQLTREANQPLCPVYDGCKEVGQLPRDQASAQSTTKGPQSSGSTFSCSSGAMTGATSFFAVVGLAAVAAVRALRRRDKR
jgi:MYXO-CTERM domain-containing protein